MGFYPKFDLKLYKYMNLLYVWGSLASRGKMQISEKGYNL